MHLSTDGLGRLLGVLVLLHGALGGQAQAPKLNLVVVEGDGAINNIRQRTAREPLVQVEDENRRPVAGAAVTFLLPNQGPSAAFPDGSRTLTVFTDEQGRAVARGLRPNGTAGKFEIRISATHEGQTATATITQTNALAAAAAAGGISGKLIAILAIAGAAAAGGVVAATRGGGSSGSGPSPGPTRPAPTVISPGTGTVGPPR